MKHTIRTIFALLLCLTMALGLCLCACGNPAPTPDTPTPPAEDDTPPAEGDTPPASIMPTAADVVSAIQTQAAAAEQNYDFVLKLSGNINVGALRSPNANAVYTCNYRYNRETEDLRFKRVTSGILLYDSTEYIYSSGDSRITVKMNDKGAVKKVITDYRDTELRLINLPFQSLVESFSADEITEIGKDGSGYIAKLRLSSENAVLNTICGLIGRMDTSISLKGVQFTNPVSGIDFKFELTGKALTGYTLNASVSIPVSSADVTLDLSYEMKTSSAAVSIPSVTGFVTDKAEIAAELSKIDGALKAVKQETVYSLDLEALNEMDPGWNVKATKDTYQSRLYKRTDETGFTHFNNSYEYHSHHETDGKETYKYTYGNVTDDEFGTYLVSRKGSNTYENAEGVTADTRFDFMTEVFAVAAEKTDCLSKKTEGTTDTYTVYLSDDAVVEMMERIVGILNSNPAQGVLTVENYFNGVDHTVKDAQFTVVMTAGKLVSMELDTKIKYNPTEGEYTEQNVTLDNSLILKVNDRLEKAQGYEAPKKAKATLIFGGLDYILDLGK